MPHDTSAARQVSYCAARFLPYCDIVLLAFRMQPVLCIPIPCHAATCRLIILHGVLVVLIGVNKQVRCLDGKGVAA